MSSPYDDTSENENRQPRHLDEKEVEVVGLWETRGDEVVADGPIGDVIVLLRDGRGRRLSIAIGPFETMAIHNAIQRSASERPMTHDLLRNCIERLGGTVERILIDDLWQGTYYAKIQVSRAQQPALEIDSRPSDAIALALRVQAPIFVAERVLDEASQED